MDLEWKETEMEALNLADNALKGLKPDPAWDVSGVRDMVDGLWALSLYIAVGAWICAAIAWIAGRVIHSGPMQQYSGTVFIWCALATMILGSAMAIVKFFATQALF